MEIPARPPRSAQCECECWIWIRAAPGLAGWHFGVNQAFAGPGLAAGAVPGQVYLGFDFTAALCLWRGIQTWEKFREGLGSVSEVLYCCLFGVVCYKVIPSHNGRNFIFPDSHQGWWEELLQGLLQGLLQECAGDAWCHANTTGHAVPSLTAGEIPVTSDKLPITFRIQKLP